MSGLVACPEVLDLPQEGPLPERLVSEIIDRAAGYERWREQVAATGYCVYPIRLRGRVSTVDAATGEVLPRYSTEGEPDGVLLTSCGSRRAADCPACSALYRADTFHLVAAGIRGGKGVPESVSAHPMLFVTLTAPSFGAVHAHRTKHGAVLPCRPRRGDGRCPHGLPLSCRVRHEADDPRVGQALCPRCFEYEGLVAWNALAPELWRRTATYLRRALAKAAGVSERRLRQAVALRFFKVAELQARGAVHFHLVVRLDGVAENPEEVACPPDEFTAELLEQALRSAVASASAPAPQGRCARWGTQLEVHRIAGSGELSAEAVAAYVAKYATKGSEGVGPARRIEDEGYLGRIEASPHVVRLVRAAWDLGGRASYGHLRLRRWAHQFGFGGHFATKSRRYSTTMGALRRARADYASRRAQGEDQPLGELAEEQGPEEIRLASWVYAGAGYRSAGEVFLALQAAAEARDYRELAREAKLYERQAV